MSAPTDAKKGAPGLTQLLFEEKMSERAAWYIEDPGNPDNTSDVIRIENLSFYDVALSGRGVKAYLTSKGGKVSIIYLDEETKTGFTELWKF